MNSTNFYEEACQKLGIHTDRRDEFAIEILEFLDDPKNYFIIKRFFSK